VLVAALAMLAAPRFGGEAAQAERPVVVLELSVDPAVAAAAGANELAHAVERTAEAALDDQFDFEIELAEQPFVARFAEALRALPEYVAASEACEGYRAALDAGAREGDPAAADTARTACDEAKRQLTARLDAGPLVGMAAGRIGADITDDPLHGASRAGSERWFLVDAGVALSQYDGEQLRQSIANSVVQGLGQLSGLEARDGAPSEAMSTRLDIMTGELAARDRSPVGFNADEISQVAGTLATVAQEQ
jgi:hypothetical protein